MNLQAIYQKLEGQCPSNYRINEIIPIAYPYRRVTISATVNKTPEESIQQVYAVFIKAIKFGMTSEEELIHFLGLDKDAFILRELYFLRERGYLELVSGNWLATEMGEKFIKDNSILKILVEEAFDFYIDAYTDEVILNDFVLQSHTNTPNKIEPKLNYPIKSSELIKDKSGQIAEVYKKAKLGKAYLVDYNSSEIKFDKKDFNDYYLIEYIPTREKENELDPIIEIRNIDKDVSLNKRLTKILLQEYPSIFYQFSESDRSEAAQIEKENKNTLSLFERVSVDENIKEVETLSIWETKSKFIEAIQNANSKLLIESPWIKRATLAYIDVFEAALKRKVFIIVLYGIEGNDEHDRKAQNEMERLDLSYSNFKLIHLPTHFENTGNTKMVGSHKKLVIKDNDYYIQGSFNFLSFNKSEGEKVANEETLMIRLNVEQKWNKVLNDYNIKEVM